MAGTAGRRTLPKGKKEQEGRDARAKFIKDVNAYFIEERKRVGADRTGMYSTRASLEFSNKKGRKVPHKIAGVNVVSTRALGEYRKPGFEGKEKVHKGKEQARIRLFIPTIKEFAKGKKASLAQAKKTIRHELAHHKRRRNLYNEPVHGNKFKTAKRTIDRKSRVATNKNPKRTKQETRPMPKKPRK